MVRVQAALERGHATEATQFLAQALRSTSITREDELAIRCTLAEAWFLQDDITQASAALGRPPDALRETIPAVLATHLWRLHGRVAAARGEQSRAIALHSRALGQAELAREPRAIGLAHFELARCYKQVGDTGTMRDHFAAAASALHAVGDKRNLALVHSLSGSALAQSGRWDEALTTYRQAERLATAVKADDVLAIVCGNQANVAMMRHRYDEALALAERSVSLHEQFPPGHGLAVALATLGQICIRLGTLARAESVLQRALEVRRALLFHETTGAIFDSLAQVHLIRGSFDQAEEYLRKSREAYGAYDRQTPRWYDWSLQLLDARLALRRGALDQAVSRADTMIRTPSIPPADMLHAQLIAAEALLEAGRVRDAEQRLELVVPRLDPRTTPGAWAEFLRVRAELHSQTAQPGDAYHELAQSISTFELLGERYEAARSQLVLGRLAARAGARSMAVRHLSQAAATFEALGAESDMAATERARALLAAPGTGEFIGAAADADDAIVRRLVDAAALPELLARETVSALLEINGADAVVLFVRFDSGGEPRVLAHAGCDEDAARALARSAAQDSAPTGTIVLDGFGSDADGPRRSSRSSPVRDSTSAPRVSGRVRRTLRSSALSNRYSRGSCA
jgi:tetratricopeptide (TPR) repeat protein